MESLMTGKVVVMGESQLVAFLKWAWPSVFMPLALFIKNKFKEHKDLMDSLEKSQQETSTSLARVEEKVDAVESRLSRSEDLADQRHKESREELSQINDKLDQFIQAFVNKK